MDIENKG